MMNKRTISILCIILYNTLVFSVFAQRLTNPQRRNINFNLYVLLEKYSRYGKLSSNFTTINDHYLEEFRLIFMEQATVLNDVLPYNRVDHQITIDNYINLLKEYYSAGVGFKLHDIQTGIPEKVEDGVYKVNVSAIKEIYSITSHNANYKDTLALMFTINFRVVNNNPQDFSISMITGETMGRRLRLLCIDEETGKPLKNALVKFQDEDFYTTNSGRIEFKNLDPGKKYSYYIEPKKYRKEKNENFYVDELILSESNSSGNEEYYDPNEIIHYFNKASNSFISIHISPSITTKSLLFSDYKVKNVADETNFEYKAEQDFGLGFKAGHTILSRDPVGLDLVSGIEFYTYSSNYTIENFQRKIDKAYDFYEDTCIMDIHIKESSQIFKVKGLTIPFHLLFRYSGFNGFDINMESGINYNFLLEKQFETNDDIDGYVEGQYKQYNNQVISNDSILGFGNYKGSINAVDWYVRNLFSFYLSPSINWKFTSNLEIYVGPAFIVGLGNLTKNNEINVLSKDFPNLNPVVFSKKTRLQLATFEFGLRYNFSERIHSNINIFNK